MSLLVAGGHETNYATSSLGRSARLKFTADFCSNIQWVERVGVAEERVDGVEWEKERGGARRVARRGVQSVGCSEDQCKLCTRQPFIDQRDSPLARGTDTGLCLPAHRLQSPA